MGSSPHISKVTLFRRLCQRTMLVEASTALRYLRAWIRFCGRGKHMEGFAQISSLSSRK